MFNNSQSPLSVFGMIADGVDKNLEAVKTAEAEGLQQHVDELFLSTPTPQKTKEASAQEKLSADHDLCIKIAEAGETLAEMLEAGFINLKEAADAGAGQPPGDGPENNETKDWPTNQHFQPSEGKSTNTGQMMHMEDGGRGNNHIATNEERNYGGTHTDSGTALGPLASGSRGTREGSKKEAHTHDHNLTRSGVINFLKSAAGAAAGQPPGEGPKDNEVDHIPNPTPGDDTVRRSTGEVIDQTPQKEENHAKGQEFPLSEGQYHANTRAGGDGPGPSSKGSPDPEKVAKARTFLQQVANAPGTPEHARLREAVSKLAAGSSCAEVGGPKDNEDKEHRSGSAKDKGKDKDCKKCKKSPCECGSKKKESMGIDPMMGADAMG